MGLRLRALDGRAFARSAGLSPVPVHRVLKGRVRHQEETMGVVVQVLCNVTLKQGAKTLCLNPEPSKASGQLKQPKRPKP